MPKVLLVEDDNNLREIFEMRLQAEGYQTVTAGNGEEGLTIAMKEKPDLIIADVMMPKLSGFDMLESLRAAPDMKNTKVIMMTALGQAEDQARGEKLGVVKYLVKSQATLEDFAKVIKDVMPPDGAPAAVASNQISNQQESEKKMQDDQTPTTPTNDAPAMPAQDMTAPAAAPAGDMPAMPTTPATEVAPAPTMDAASTNPVSAPAENGQMTMADEQSQVQGQMDSFASSMPTTPADSAAPAVTDSTTAQPSSSFAPTTPADASATAPYDQPAATTDAAESTAAAPAGDMTTPTAESSETPVAPAPTV